MSERIPKISIGMPVYNGEKYLRAALDSILQQDYTDYELIISDNASTDATQNICQEYAATHGCIRYYRNESNIGASGNFNRLVKLARGEFFKWAAHDDVCLPGFLRRCMEVLNHAPASVVLVAPKAVIIDMNGQELPCVVEHLHTEQRRPHQRIAETLRVVAWATFQFGLIRTAALRKTRLIDAFYGADYVLLVELVLLGEIREVPEVLFQRRFHPGASTLANKSPDELAAWFDPLQKGAKSILSPTMRCGVECLRSIRRLRPPLGERLLCYWAVVAVWGARECRRLSAKYRDRIAIRTRLKRFFRFQTLSG